MTYSILGYDPSNSDLGVAVQSKFPNVGGLVPYGQAKVGAVATQGFANPRHGSVGLELLRCGAEPRQVVEILLRGDDLHDQRQFAVVDAQGRSASHTGSEVHSWEGWAGDCTGAHCLALGNGLAAAHAAMRIADSAEAVSRIRACTRTRARTRRTAAAGTAGAPGDREMGHPRFGWGRPSKTRSSPIRNSSVTAARSSLSTWCPACRIRRPCSVPDESRVLVGQAGHRGLPGTVPRRPRRPRLPHHLGPKHAARCCAIRWREHRPVRGDRSHWADGQPAARCGTSRADRSGGSCWPKSRSVRMRSLKVETPAPNFVRRSRSAAR